MSAENLLTLFKAEEKQASHKDLRQISSVVSARMKIFLSYKIWMIIEIVNSVVSIAVYFFLGKQVVPGELEKAGYGSSFLAFALVGIASQTFLWTSVSRIGMVLGVEMDEGTFESITATRLRIRNYLLGQTLAGFILSTWFFTGAMLSGIFILSAPLTLSPATVVTAVVLIFVMVLAHLGIGFIAAAGILVLKRGEPIIALFSVLTQFLSGVLFPFSLLPGGLELVARSLPFTYALRSLRFSLLTGETLTDSAIIQDIIICGIFALFLIPFGIRIFDKALNYAKTVGVAGHY